MNRVSIEFERAVDPILGTVRSESEPDRPFAGWMGLLAALEAVLESSAQAGETSPAAEPRD